MSQALISNLTLKIEQEKQMMQEHQANIKLFHQSTDSLLSSAEKSLKSLQLSVQRTTENATNRMEEAKLSLASVQTESQNLALSLQQQTKETATLLNQQAQQLKQLQAKSAELCSISQQVAATAKIKKSLLTSNIVMASVVVILIISSLAFGYVSKSRYNEMQQVKVLQQVEQQKLAEVNQALTLSKKELSKKYPQIAFKD